MNTIVLFVAITLAPAAAEPPLYEVVNRGIWPKTWPAELEILRKQSRTLIGPMLPRPHYEIPFTDREKFEAAWEHLLRVKTSQTPIFIVRAPDSRLGTKIGAGVRIYSPPPQKGKRVHPEKPMRGRFDNRRERWMYTTFIELIVDGKVVDLNRIRLPEDTMMIDERFANRPAK